MFGVAAVVEHTVNFDRDGSVEHFAPVAVHHNVLLQAEIKTVKRCVEAWNRAQVVENVLLKVRLC